MNKRPIAVICFGMIFLILLSGLLPLPVPWAAGTDRKLQQAMLSGADCTAYGQIYRIEKTGDGCAIYLKNTILVIQSNSFFLENSKINYEQIPEVQVGWSVCAEGYGYLPEKPRKSVKPVRWKPVSPNLTSEPLRSEDRGCLHNPNPKAVSSSPVF